MRRRGLLVAAVLLALALVYVDEEAYRTLQILDSVERERDRWQRPEAVLDALALRPGETVVDLGSGAGYFAMKIAPRVAPAGRCLPSIFGASRSRFSGSGRGEPAWAI